LTAKAFSAGGVLVAAVANRRPGLFDKVVLTNAFLDVLKTMQNPSLFLTEHEYPEFGDPQSDNDIDEVIRFYCPVYNLQPDLQANAGTEFLLICSLDDSNVPYWNSTIYYKKLVSGVFSTESNPKKRIFLDIQTEGGHSIVGPNRIHVSSIENAFLLNS